MKRTKMCRVHVPTPQDGCHRYVPHTCANTNLIKIMTAMTVDSLLYLIIQLHSFFKAHIFLYHKFF